MPCWTVIRILRGLQTLDEIEEALKEAQWEYTRNRNEIVATNPYTNTTMTFQGRSTGVTCDDAPRSEAEDTLSTLRSYKKAKEVKAKLRNKGFKVKSQKRVGNAIKIRMGG